MTNQSDDYGEIEEPESGLLRKQFDRRHFIGFVGAGAAATAMAHTKLPSLRPGAGAAEFGEEESAHAFGKVTLAEVKKLLGPMTARSMGTGKKVRIGADLLLSGQSSYYGLTMAKGINLAVAQIKAMGGPHIEVVYQDIQGGDAQVSISNVRTLAGSGVEFLFSSLDGSLGAILPEIAQSKILSINTGGGAPQPPFDGAPYYWETDGNVDQVYPLAAKYFHNKYPNAKTIAYISPDQGAAVNAAGVANFNKYLNPFGLSITSEQYTTFGMTSGFSALVSNVETANPDIVIANLTPSLGLFMTSYAQAGLKAPVFNIGTALSTTDLTDGGSAMTGVGFISQYFNPQVPQNPWGAFFVQEWNKKYGAKRYFPDLYGTNYYISAFTFWELMRMAWAKGKEPTSELLEGFLNKGPTLHTLYGGNSKKVGTVKINPKTHFANSIVGVYIVQANGSFKQAATTNSVGGGYFPG
jgi:ABC-type branched-subunit amino acid transport system substrate-binding protein